MNFYQLCPPGQTIALKQRIYVRVELLLNQTRAANMSEARQSDVQETDRLIIVYENQTNYRIPSVHRILIKNQLFEIIEIIN